MCFHLYYRASHREKENEAVPRTLPLYTQSIDVPIDANILSVAYPGRAIGGFPVKKRE